MPIDSDFGFLSHEAMTDLTEGASEEAETESALDA